MVKEYKIPEGDQAKLKELMKKAVTAATNATIALVEFKKAQEDVDHMKEMIWNFLRLVLDLEEDGVYSLDQDRMVVIKEEGSQASVSDSHASRS